MMKRLAGFGGKVALSLVLLFVSFFASYSYFKAKAVEYDGNGLTKFADAEAEFYLQHAEPYIAFSITAEPALASDSLFTLRDDEGTLLQPETRRAVQRQTRIMPPKSGYEPGGRYTLELADGVVFSDAELADARTLVFSIKREDTEQYTLADNVSLLTEETLQQATDDRLTLPEGQWTVGDIVLGLDNNGEYAAYKIAEMLNESGPDGQVALVETPGLDEIFSDLQVHKKIDLDFADIVANPDLHSQIVDNVRASSFFDALVMRAYAEGGAPDKDDLPIKVAFEPKDGGLNIEVTFTLKAGENGLFGIKALQRTQVELTLSAWVALSVTPDIRGVTNMEITSHLKTTFAFEVNISPQEETYERTLQDAFNKKNYADLTAYKEYVGTIIDTLKQINTDRTQGEIKLFDWSVPLPGVPLLTVGAEVKLFVKFGIAGEILMGNDYSYNVVSGLMFKKGQFRPHFRIDKGDVEREGVMSVKGKAEFKAGIKLLVKMSVISDKIAGIRFDPQAGVYGDLFLTWPVQTPKELTQIYPLYVYAEGGLYAEVNFNAKINFLFSEWSYTQELATSKLPIFQVGNHKIPRAVRTHTQTVKLQNDRAKLPEVSFDYYDANKADFASEHLKAEDVRFIVNDQSGLRIEGDELIADGSRTGSRISYVTAVYKHSDGQNYSTMFKVLTSGGMLEGKVSAYAEDASATQITGASVALFAGDDETAPVHSTTTDDEGKFSFTVDEGAYTLVISASGYHTLVSRQTVQKDEIRFTEHILLMDDGQRGDGLASGLVRDALNGNTLGDVTLRLRPDWNNRSGEYVDNFIAATSPAGEYTVSGVPVGYYTIEASKPGYYTDYRNITVRSDAPKLDHNFTLSPILPEDQIRVVLRWGQNPLDLDSHLIGKQTDGSNFRVYYSSKSYRHNGSEVANLDVDDTTSYGPETITLLRPVDGRTVYAVHDYSNKSSTSSDRLSYSEAVVTVFKGGRQIATYHVPTGQTGVYWVVFALEADGIPIPINTVTNINP